LRSARETIASVARSFTERDASLVGSDPLRFEGYVRQLEDARAQTSLDEACVWGLADIEGSRCALVVMDFAFLGGSMGFAVGEKVARAFDTARDERIPVVTICASGGARMQEGMIALAQMAKTVEARRRHRDAGLPHVTVLTSPTTGGVYASFASLADVIVAEPHATVGFAGPRVVAELTGETPAADVHTSEFAFDHGLIDAIVPADAVAATVGCVLRGLTP
jgi:acetyl-CoA carboxylase carboxyl transferase beta subunit